MGFIESMSADESHATRQEQVILQKYYIPYPSKVLKHLTVKCYFKITFVDKDIIVPT